MTPPTPGVNEREAQWITREEWEALLQTSLELSREADQLRRQGLDSSHVWRELRPINQRIRSPLLKVRGIDDRDGPA